MLVAPALDSDLVRAALPIATLSLLAARRAHGCELITRLRAHGFTRVQGGTLYPLLKRFEDRGLVSHRWTHDQTGPSRKEFSLTMRGTAELRRLQQAWSLVDAALSSIGSEEAGRRHEVCPGADV